MQRRDWLLVVGFLASGIGAIRQQSAEVLDISTAPTSFGTYDFDPGPMGLIITDQTGQVESVAGQAQRLGVKIGWYIFKLERHFPWSVYRWNAFKRAGYRFSVTFTDVRMRPQCQDYPIGWADSEGRSCFTYREKNMCSAYGTEGAGWTKCQWHQVGCTEQTFASVKNNDVTAAEACCACGGGWDPVGEATTSTTTTTTTTTRPTTQATTTTTESVTPPPEDKTGPEWACEDDDKWKDIYSYGCEHYESQDWCKFQHLRDFADKKGISAYDSCCACGGGHRYKKPEERIVQPQKSRAYDVAPSLGLLSALYFLAQ